MDFTFSIKPDPKIFVGQLFFLHICALQEKLPESAKVPHCCASSTTNREVHDSPSISPSSLLDLMEK